MQQHCIGVYRGNSPSHTPTVLGIVNTAAKVRTASAERIKDRLQCSWHSQLQGTKRLTTTLESNLAQHLRSDFSLWSQSSTSWISSDIPANKLPKSLISFLSRLPFTIVIDLWNEALAPLSPCQRFDREVRVCVYVWPVPEVQRWGSQTSRL